MNCSFIEGRTAAAVFYFVFIGILTITLEKLEKNSYSSGISRF